MNTDRIPGMSILACLSLTAAIAVHAAPVVDGSTIRWPDDGWYQVQRADDYTSVCEGGLSCMVDPGNYIVINHTSGQRFAGIVVASGNGGNGDGNGGAGVDRVSVDGDTIRWPDDGWYQVQRADDYTSVCEGGLSCTVDPGSYIVINHTSGQRFAGIVVASGDGGTGSGGNGNGNGGVDSVSVDGDTIRWPNDGWYQVQRANDYATVCEGGRSCRVDPGNYIVINLTRGVRFPGVRVDGSGEGPVIPWIDPYAAPIPSPDSSDPFGLSLERDPETPVSGAPPTTPKHLRIDLVSNDWAEINWAPSNDDGEVVAYRIYRSDGHVYTVGRDQVDPVAGTQAEIDKFWRTTSFIDCNYTRFSDRLHWCNLYGPRPGDTFRYEVTAVDDEGQESGRSNPITITYHLARNAPVPRYDDFYLMPDDRFAQQHDLSNTDWFLDEYSLVFADEFDGATIDTGKWQTELTWGDNRIINGEQQYFVRTQAQPDFGYDPFHLTGETLRIEAIPTPPALEDALPPICRESVPGSLPRCRFLSGALSSHDRFGFVYGYVEGRMKVGATPGQLSSFYLYHRYPGDGVRYHAPEIDIVEYLGENPYGDEDAFQTYHFADVVTHEIRSAPTMSYANPNGDRYSDDWHTYGVLWEPQLVIWYIDGREVKRMSGPMVARQPMNIVTYLVAGSAWTLTGPDADNPSLFPLGFEIDYIRAYQRPAFQGTATYGR